MLVTINARLAYGRNREVMRSGWSIVPRCLLPWLRSGRTMG